MSKRIVGLDLGERSLGVAISDPLNITAQGLTTIKFETNAYKKATSLLKELLKDIDVDKFILGYPLNMNGSLSASAQRSLEYKKRLENNFNVEVVLWDERLSSVLVDKMMIDANVRRDKRKKVIDCLAAINILQGYLDANRGNYNE
ncbi:MAG: Holliday junction resolvase RuvX [Bacilli bacterium]|jgi:putative Holliday junction resolvase|nr:Holliday junction resolvase RuvX [Bacilli bacterium]